MTSAKKSFLLAQLQEAIDEAVSESGRIGEIIAEMREGGYDLCLMLESTVTIVRRKTTSRMQCRNHGWQSPVEIDLTEADLEFLQELNIAA